MTVTQEGSYRKLPAGITCVAVHADIMADIPVLLSGLGSEGSEGTLVSIHRRHVRELRDFWRD